MAEIRVAREAGACYGVERALQMVESAAEERAGSVRTLGPLINNPRVVAGLEERGVTVVDFKSDRIRPGDEKIRAEEYRPQLEAYGRALSAILTPGEEK